MLIQNSTPAYPKCLNIMPCLPSRQRLNNTLSISEAAMNEFTFSVGSLLTGLGSLMLGHPILKNSISPTTGRTLIKVGRLLSSISSEEMRNN